ncbi:hypothetical protein [Streptomyces sp. NPDC048568]|uniref:hypothetical protein n=1 Tax=Streptomyces sp. NPDC048568 TaxID=3365571 RepID=UPI0037173997
MTSVLERFPGWPDLFGWVETGPPGAPVAPGSHSIRVEEHGGRTSQPVRDQDLRLRSPALWSYGCVPPGPTRPEHGPTGDWERPTGTCRGVEKPVTLVLTGHERLRAGEHHVGCDHH